METKKFKLEDTKKSYLLVTVFALGIGFLTELINLLPSDDFWSASSIAGTFGFWIFTTTFVIYFSSSNKNAAINTFIYLAGMNIGFYLTQGIIDYFTPGIAVTGFMQWSHLYFWLFVSVLCAGVAYFLYFWSGDNKFSSALYALPIAGLLVDTVGMCIKFYYSRTYLLQCILNIIFLVIMLVVFTKKSKSKLIFIFTVIVVAAIGYFANFSNFSQPITTQTTLICEIDGVEERYYIKVRDDGKILERTGNEEVYNEINIEEFTTLPEIVHAFQEYYESKNGTCVTID
jgi:hypothetical protein